MLKKLDPERAGLIDRNNRPRLIRAIEIIKTLGKVPKVKIDPKYRAVVRGDRNLPAVAISPVMEAIGQAGLADVAFAALNRD